MAEIKAFRGIRFNPELLGLDDVTAPPYDVITPAEQEGYYRRSPYNIVRLDLGKTSESDSNEDNRYTRAARDFTAWMSSGHLVQDDAPTIYAYRQRFEIDGSSFDNTGIICLVKLTEFGDGVLPHEKTLAGPKRDRRSLLEACEVNFSAVCALYSDPTGTVKSVLDSETAAPASAATTDEDGVEHQIWSISDSRKIESIVGSLAGKTLVIADGHHRYETSLGFANDMRSDGRARPGFNYLMMYLADMATEDLAILPTHRLINAPDLNVDRLISALSEQFQVSLLTDDGPEAPASRSNNDSVVFRCFTRSKNFRLETGRTDLAKTVEAGNSDAWKRLNTTLLQETILRPLLKINSGDPALSFTQDAKEAHRRVNAGEADLAVIVEATTIEQISAVVKVGDKMPQKSTYFYPKPRTGLVLNKL